MAKKDFKLNGFERAIAVFAPKMALNRAVSRARLGVFDDDKKRRYEAGRPSRKTMGWTTARGSSANSDIKFDLTWLRDRSSDLVQNNPYAKRAVQVITTNTIGVGIKPSIAKGSIPEVQEKRLMDLWRSWAETTECDFNGQFNIYGLMMQAWRASVERGDGFLHVVIDPKSPTIPIKLKLLEADHLDHSRDGQPTTDGGYIVSGVEFDKRGKRLAYWMFPTHPSDHMITSQLMSVRIPASEIIHVYEVLRPGQVRGIPHGVSAFLRIKDLDEYEDAQLIRQKIASCFSVFIRKNDADFMDTYEKQMADDEKDGVPLPPLFEKIHPGAMEYLQPGEDITFANPPGTTGYEPYTRSVLRSIASAYLITYEALTNDLSGVNFSSGRMGWLEMHRQIAQWQEFVIKNMFCQPVWAKFMWAADLKGVYKGKPVVADWTPPRREMIDPVKEAHGMQLLVRAGLSSKGDILRQLGLDPEKVIAEIIAEQKEADAAGLMLDSDAKWDATRVNFGIEAYLTKFQKSQAGDKTGEAKK